MSAQEVLSGNTIRLRCSFKDYDGNVATPDTVKVIIYDYNYNVVTELTSVTKTDNDEYECYYTTPKENQKVFTYEWYGEIGGEKTIARDQFITRFMKR